MDMNLESCPSCGGMLFFASGSFPASSANHRDKVETQCPTARSRFSLVGSQNTGWSPPHPPQPPPPGQSIHHPGAGPVMGAVPPMTTARTP